MYCNKCGNKLNEDAKFCDKCGKKVSNKDFNIQQKCNNVLIVTGSLQLLSYIGAIKKYDDVEKAFKVIFQNIPHAIGFNFIIIIGLIIVLVIKKKNK